MASILGVMLAFGMTFTGNPYFMIMGGFVGSFSDDWKLEQMLF